MAKKNKKTAEAPSNRSLGPLIDRLGPINNACRGAEGIDKIELFWDLGEILLQYDADAADALLRTIAERSYITRDLLRYGLIVRRGWADRADLRRTFPTLMQFSLFREALPFLKGDRCGISDQQHGEIVAMLNGSDSKDAKEFFLALKKKKIGRQHKKGQAVEKMFDTANAVRESIRQLFELGGAGKDKVRALRDAVGVEPLLRVAQLCMALAEDGTVPQTLPEPAGWPDALTSLVTNLRAVSQANREDRAGFRKALGAVRLMEAADLINALRTDEQLAQWESRRRMKLNA